MNKLIDEFIATYKAVIHPSKNVNEKVVETWLRRALEEFAKKAIFSLATVDAAMI